MTSRPIPTWGKARAWAFRITRFRPYTCSRMHKVHHFIKHPEFVKSHTVFVTVVNVLNALAQNGTKCNRNT